MTVSVALAGLEVRADGRTLLGPVDLEVSDGEHVLLIGASGSGKTTLLRAVAGLATPSAGTVDLFGERASSPGRLHIEPRHRGIGFLFQGGALWPHMNVRKTLSFALKCAGVPRSEHEARIAELLSEVELTGYENRRSGTLSGGEGQRLALARALAAGPRLLLLDEPLGPLDGELRSSLLDTLGNLHSKHGWTTIHVTHDPGEAERIATRTVRIEEGRISS